MNQETKNCNVCRRSKVLDRFTQDADLYGFDTCGSCKKMGLSVCEECDFIMLEQTDSRLCEYCKPNSKKCSCCHQIRHKLHFDKKMARIYNQCDNCNDCLRCRKCDEIRPSDRFLYNQISWSYQTSECKDCYLKKMREESEEEYKRMYESKKKDFKNQLRKKLF